VLGEHSTAVYDVGLINQTSRGATLPGWETGRTRLICAGFLEEFLEPRWLQLAWRWGRYYDHTANELADLVPRALGPILGNLPIIDVVVDIVTPILIEKGVLGGEGNSDGPESIKFKDNWFQTEDA
jgi:hypothetical protein